ncbi:MAG: hypothetical protein HQ559_08415 [Lentisphaerae bacterium]|nr:hypothetical protein [Lentisphaerota bacterium]
MNAYSRVMVRIALCAMAILVAAAARGETPPLVPSFDPDKVAEAETKMWKAYYSMDKAGVVAQLRTLIQQQHGVTAQQAREISEAFGRSAMMFELASGNYDVLVLPDLTKAYIMAKAASGASFDPKKAARAELAWWVARRTPGKDSAEQVGKKIAELYTLLFGGKHRSFEKAGLLRAQAAGLRDRGGRNADWARVQKLLQQSYRSIKEPVEQALSRARSK